jgi:hypothetical protein
MANNVHVSYDLYAPEKNYERVIAKIKTLGSWAKIHKSFWYIDTNLTAEQVRNAVWSAMDTNDSLYVVDSTNNMAAWQNISEPASKHIRDHWRLQAA